MEKNIAVIWGDCSSPEIVKQTIRVLDKVVGKVTHPLILFTKLLIFQ